MVDAAADGWQGAGAYETSIGRWSRRVAELFVDYWTPFLSGVGPAPAYCAALTADQREALLARRLARLWPSGAGPIVLTARAVAVHGTVQPAHA
jgi:hypothetical protein